jgi:hypothetical protein
VDPEFAFILFAVFVILSRKFLGKLFKIREFNLGFLHGFRKILERPFELEGFRIGALLGFPSSILSFFFLSLILASGETSLTFIERVGYMIDLGDPATNIIRCSLAVFATFVVGCIGGKIVTHYVDTNLGELGRKSNIVYGVIVFGLLVGGPCSFVFLLCMSNS